MRDEYVTPHNAPQVFFARVSLGLGLARSCNNESDRLFPGETSCPMIPDDAAECAISPRDSNFTLSYSPRRLECLGPVDHVQQYMRSGNYS